MTKTGLQNIAIAGRPKLIWSHPKYYPCICPACNWIGMSNEAAGGNQIADTGDYNDIVCPICIAPNGDYTKGGWVVLDEFTIEEYERRNFEVE